MTERQQQALADAKLALDISNRSPKRALELAHNALSFDNSGEGIIQAHALAAYGSAYASLGLYEEASRYIHQAQSVAFENRLTHVMARIHQARGWLSLSQGDPVAAFSDWQIAVDYFQQVRDLRGTAWILLHYAENYSTLGLEDHAIRCKASALELSECLGEPESIAELQLSMAHSYVSRAWGRFFIHENDFCIVDAQIAAAIVLAVLERPDLLSPRWLESAYHLLGESMVLLQRPQEALPNLSVALEAASKNGQFVTEARVRGAIGYAHWQLGNTDLASQYLEEALAETTNDTPNQDQLAITLWLAKVVESSNDYQRGLQLLWRGLEIESQMHQKKLQFWSNVHDHTLGLGQALRPQDWVTERENHWALSEKKLADHQTGLPLLRVTDPLTGLINRSAFAAEAWPHAFLVSIVGLDAVNSKFGRTAGDEVLKSAASILAASLLDGTTIARWSGDTFAVASDEISQNIIDAAFQRYPWKSICPGIKLSLVFSPFAEDKKAA